MSEDPAMSLRQQINQTEPEQIGPGIFKATGFGNTFMVITQGGYVVIDTSLRIYAPRHRDILSKISKADPRYIVITHAHGDHVGGLETWRGADTEVIMHKRAIEFIRYQTRLAGFFARRNAAQFNIEIPPVDTSTRVDETKNVPDATFVTDGYSFELGETNFEIIATPGETPDGISVWLPERKAIFVGDLYYKSFPNIYTLRGTKPRWPLQYIESLNRIIALDAEILIPSHGEPVFGIDEVRNTLIKYRDAIRYVHNETIRGMNEGMDVDTIVAKVKLPEPLRLPQTYGRVDWSVRGIIHGYSGWFDGEISSVLGIKPSEAAHELVQLAGGPDRVSARAVRAMDEGEMTLALALSDRALEVAPCHLLALSVRRAVLLDFVGVSKNYNERGWLLAAVRDAEARIATRITHLFWKDDIYSSRCSETID